MYKLLAFLVLAANAFAQAEKDLEAAMNKEVVQGDVNGAIALYRKILSRYGSQREVAAKALFHLGQCHEKLGQTEARKSYERLVKEFPEQKDLAAQARARLASLGGSATGGGLRVHRVFDGSQQCQSPTYDDQWTVCSKDGELYIRNLASSKETRLPHTPEEVRNPGGARLSADGQWLAYQSSAGYPGKLWLTPVNGSAHRKLELPANLRRSQALSFSPGNKLLLVFVELEGPGRELWLYSVPDGTGRKLYDGRDVQWIAPGFFTPDGEHVIFRAQYKNWLETQIFSIPVRGGEPRRLPAQAGETPVGFTGDGKLVIHSPDRAGEAALWALALRDGLPQSEPQLLTRGVSKTSPGRYHPSGNYYYSLDLSRHELLAGQLKEGTAVRPATTRGGGQGVAPAYSPDGRYLAYGHRDRETGQVIVRHLESGKETMHLSSLSWLNNVQWYPDGKALMVFGSRADSGETICVKIDLATAEVSNVFTNMGRTDASTNPLLSPDGRYIYYKRFADFDKVGYEGMRVHRFDLRTRADQEVYRAPAGGMVRLFALSRDGSQLAIGGRQAAGKDKPNEDRRDWIAVAPASGGEGKMVLRHSGDTGMRGYNGIAWTADGKSIIYHTVIRDTGGDILWLLPLDGGPARKLFETGTIWNIAVHPNGQDFILDSRTYKRELWVMEGVK